MKSRSRKPAARAARQPTFETARRMALALPGVVEGMSYGTPGFRVRGRFLARIKEDGDSLVLRVDMDEREALMAADPETFYITEHYRGYPAVLVRLSRVHPGDLQRLLEDAWRRNASKKLIEEHAGGARRRT